MEGLSFHVGSQTTNFDNYVQALHLAAGIFKEAATARLHKINLLDIGGGFPAPYDENVQPLEDLAKILNSELDRLFPAGHRDPRRAGPLPRRHRRHRRVRSHRQGPPRRQALLLHQRRRLPHLLGHHLRPLPVSPASVQEGPDAICSVFGPTCDALDTISLAEELPDCTWATWSTARTSAPTATPPRPTSTASRRRR